MYRFIILFLSMLCIASYNVEVIQKGGYSKKYTIQCPEDSGEFSILKYGNKNLLTRPFTSERIEYLIQSTLHIYTYKKAVTALFVNVSFSDHGTYVVLCETSEDNKNLMIVIGVRGTKYCQRYYNGKPFREIIHCEMTIGKNVHLNLATNIENPDNGMFIAYPVEGGKKENIELYSKGNTNNAKWKLNVTIDILKPQSTNIILLV